VRGQAARSAVAQVVARPEIERVATRRAIRDAVVVDRARPARAALGAKRAQVRRLAAVLRVADPADRAHRRSLAELVAGPLARDAGARDAERVERAIAVLGAARGAVRMVGVRLVAP